MGLPRIKLESSGKASSAFNCLRHLRMRVAKRGHLKDAPVHLCISASATFHNPVQDSSPVGAILTPVLLHISRREEGELYGEHSKGRLESCFYVSWKLVVLIISFPSLSAEFAKECFRYFLM